MAAETRKTKSAQRIINHFPLRWFGPPAVLKGWLDRCFEHGELHTSTQRFDAGSCIGKKAIFCVSQLRVIARSYDMDPEKRLIGFLNKF